MAFVRARRVVASALETVSPSLVAAVPARAAGGDAAAAALVAAPVAVSGARPRRLTERERRWVWVTDLPFLICALAALVWLPALRPLDPLLCLLLVGGYAVASRVRFPLLGLGYAPAVQLIFVPMLFLAPLNLVLLLVAAGGLIDVLASRARADRHPGRQVLALGDSWYALGPVAVLAVAGQQEFAWEHWPTYAAAFAAQFAVSMLLAYPRAAIHTGRRPPLGDAVGLPTVINLTLTMPALTAVAIAGDAPLAATLSLVSLLAIACGVSSERSARLVERHLATHDPLTGLPNRPLFAELAAAAAARARRDGRPCAVMLVDLNDFKSINDEFGHEAGDRVLVQAADRLRASVRAADTVARLGGDEFGVLLVGEQTPGTCAKVADKLRRAFRSPLHLAAGRRCVGISVGVALVAGEHELPDALREADAAMYADKPPKRPRPERRADAERPARPII